MSGAEPFIMAGASVASGIMSGVGAMSQGNAAYSAGAENARILGENAGRLRRAADLEEQQGVTAAARARRQGRMLRGNTLAALSVSGVDVFEGSPLEILTEQSGESEFQALQAKFEHDQKAWQLRAQAYDTSQRANMTLRYGQQQRDAAYTQGFGQIVGGVVRGGAAGFDLLSPGADAAPKGGGAYGGPNAARPD